MVIAHITDIANIPDIISHIAMDILVHSLIHTLVDTVDTAFLFLLELEVCVETVDAVEPTRGESSR